MNKLHFPITINAPKDKVWHTMLDEKTYPQWAAEFMPGPHYVGDWNKGSKILFLGPHQNGRLGGMVSRIKEYKQYESIAIEHLGIVFESVEDTTSDTAKSWAGAFENYTFEEKGGLTELMVDMYSIDVYEEMFRNTWPKALQRLKELAER